MTRMCNLTSQSHNITINDLNLNRNMKQETENKSNNITAIETQFNLNNEQKEAFQMITEHSLKDSPLRHSCV